LLIENLGLDSDLDTDSLDPDTDSVNPDTLVFRQLLYNLLVRPFFYSFLMLAISPLMELMRVKLYCPLVDPLISRLK
jgi:hypothetical protein